MTREFLIGLGLADETAEAVMTEFDETIKKSYIPLTRFNEVNSELKNQRDTVNMLNGQLEELKKVDVGDLQNKITELQNANQKAQTDYERRIAEIKMTNAVDKALGVAKAKNLKAVKALLNMDELKLNGDVVDGIEEQLKNLQDDESTSFLFDTAEAKPTMTGVNPAPTGGNTPPEEGAGAHFAQLYNAKYSISKEE